MKRTAPTTLRNFCGVITLSFFFWVPLSKAQPSQENTPAKVTLCELAEHPDIYAGKIVETQASVIGRELWIDDFSGPKCSAYMRLFLAFPQNVRPEPAFDVVRDANYEKLFDALYSGMNVVATFKGRFDPLFTWRNHKRERVSQDSRKGFWQETRL